MVWAELRTRLRPRVEPEPLERIDMGNGVVFELPPEHRRRPDDVLSMGRHSYATPHVEWHAGDTNRVIIGSFCSINHTVRILVGGDHNPEWVTTYPIRVRFGLPGAFTDGQPRSRGDVVIGNDVFIGHSTLILSGVTIGDGAVVGAGSVVSRDVEPYAVVAGSPASFRRWRFTEDQRRRLLVLRWWEWDDERIKAEVGALCSDRIDEFLDRHEV